jgi:hypothetical protein
MVEFSISTINSWPREIVRSRKINPSLRKPNQKCILTAPIVVGVLSPGAAPDRAVHGLAEPAGTIDQQSRLEDFCDARRRREQLHPVGSQEPD